jgi:hypothetical protein
MNQETLSKMKTSSLIIFAPIISISSARGSLRIPDFPASLIRTLSSDTCLGDMEQLEISTNLAVTLQMSLNDFTQDFETRPKEYCYSRRMDSGRTESECMINFKKFTPTYRTMCLDAEAEYFPISLFMHCYNEDLDLEMELINIPSCLAHTCGDNEITNAVGRLLESSDAQNALNELSCDYFHRTAGVSIPSNAPDNARRCGFGTLLIGAISLGFYAF